MLRGILFFFLVQIFILAQDVPIPKIPERGNKSKFIPKDWEVLSETKGDLNNDKQEDIALVLKHKNEENLEDPPRILLICFQEKPDSYKLIAVSTKAILKKTEGGVMGDPFQGINWNRGSILIEHYGGSSQRWSSTHRFQYRNNEFVLIGKTLSYMNILTGESETIDKNLLTGKTIITTTDANGKTKSQTKNEGKKALKKLKEFDPSEPI